MESKRLTIRLSDAQLRAVEAEAKAEGITPSEWVRRLIEKDTGVQAAMLIGGFAHMSKRRRRQVAAKGGKAKAAKAHDNS